ncbi:MAG: ParB/RepB/Spo0J family partition protein [Pseudohongiellaceae bacterium]
MEIQNIPIKDLKPYKYSTTYLVRSDFRSLTDSVRKVGMLSPIIVRKSSMEVIDGKYRLSILQADGIETAPCIVLDIDATDAMILHVQINRYRAEVISKDLSKLVRRIVISRKYSEDETMAMLALTHDEFNVLFQGSVIRQRNIPDHVYSHAWVPVESDSPEDFKIERPTGAPEQNK